jgi:cytidyltransferase-like protein
MKDKVKRLFVLQLREGGIAEDVFHFLPEDEQDMLEEKDGRSFLKPEFRKLIKVVLTGGVFDIIHIGHVYTLNEAKKLGDVLVVAVAGDVHIEKKKRKPIHSQEYRAAMVEFLKPVDVALLGRARPKDLLEFVGPDVIVYGYDQEPFVKPVGVEVVKLERSLEPDRFKTSRIIEELGV